MRRGWTRRWPECSQLKGIDPGELTCAAIDPVPALVQTGG